MSTNPRKRHGGADDSGQTQKWRRLLASSTGEASEPEPADLEESGTLSFELAGEEFIGVTADSPESEDINLTDNDSGNVVQGEQNEQHPIVSRAADELIVLLESDDDVEPSSSLASDDGSPPRDMGSSPRDSDGPWSSSTASSSSRMDEFSEQWEQYQELPLLSIVVDDSVALLANDDDEELRDNDGLFGPLTSVTYADCFLWKLEQNQLYPLASRAADNSVLLLASDDEEEGRSSNSAWSSSTASSSSRMDEFSELLEECEQERSLSDSFVWSDDDGDEATDGDESVTDSASEEEDLSEEETGSSDAWPAPTIKCPICMDFYPQIVRSGRMVLSTLCGHIFCSHCLPVALQTVSFCPTCRADLPPEQYHPIYI